MKREHLFQALVCLWIMKVDLLSLLIVAMHDEVLELLSILAFSSREFSS